MSRAQTLTAPSLTTVSAIGSTVGPALLAKATSVPQRALIRNAGPVTILISYVAQAVSDLSAVQDAYRLDPGFADVFVLEVRIRYTPSASATTARSRRGEPGIPTWQPLG